MENYFTKKHLSCFMIKYGAFIVDNRLILMNPTDF